MIKEKGWQWASHQPMIKGVLKLFEPKFVLELGVGENSTPLFKEFNYVGIENDHEWIDHIRELYGKKIIWHNLDRKSITLADYYNSIQIPILKPKLLFVDNYESCRLIAINTLRDKFELIIFHDCEPEPGARINHYQMINSIDFNVYFLKTPANWTGLMIKISSGLDNGFSTLLQSINPFILKFKKEYLEMECMYLDNVYEGFTC
jgi:hypothetical protein